MSNSRTFLLLYLAVMTTAMGQTLVFALLPLLGRSVHLREVQVGTVITLSSLVFALATRQWGRWSNSLGRRRIIQTGLLGYSVGTLVFASLFWLGMHGYVAGMMLWGMLILSRCLQSSVMAGTSPGVTAYVTDITHSDSRTVAIARIGAANTVGTIVGPALAGGIAGLSLLAPLFLAASMTLLAWLMVTICLPESPRIRQAVVSDKDNPIHLSYTDRRYRDYLLIGIAMFTAFAMIQQTLGFYFQDRLALSSTMAASRVGFALMVSAVIALLAQGILVQRLHWRPFRLIVSGLAMLWVGSLLLCVAHDYLVLVSAVAFASLGLGLCGPGCAAAATMVIRNEEQGALAGLLSALPALGTIVGPLLGTALYQCVPILPYLFNVVLLVPVMAFAYQRLPR